MSGWVWRGLRYRAIDCCDDGINYQSYGQPAKTAKSKNYSAIAASGSSCGKRSA